MSHTLNTVGLTWANSYISLPYEVSLSGFESLNFRRPITVCGSDTSCVISARIVAAIAAISCHPRCVGGGGSPRPPCFSQSKNGAPPAASKPFALFSPVFSLFSVGDAVRGGILVACVKVGFLFLQFSS